MPSKLGYQLKYFQYWIADSHMQEANDGEKSSKVFFCKLLLLIPFGSYENKQNEYVIGKNWISPTIYILRSYIYPFTIEYFFHTPISIKLEIILLIMFMSHVLFCYYMLLVNFLTRFF